MLDLSVEHLPGNIPGCWVGCHILLSLQLASPLMRVPARDEDPTRNHLGMSGHPMQSLALGMARLLLALRATQ